MDRPGWFPLDYAFTPNKTQRAFMEALRRRAEAWPPRSGLSTYFEELDVLDSDVAVAKLTIRDPERLTELITLGAHLDGTKVTCDKVHNQLALLPDEPTEMGMSASGTPEELAERAADWFEALAKRPVLLHEWVFQERVYAFVYLFADSTRYLTAMYREDWAPPGQRERLIAEGHVFGKGWIQPQGIGTPDRITRVR